jgi:hypothetical protein
VLEPVLDRSRKVDTQTPSAQRLLQQSSFALHDVVSGKHNLCTHTLFRQYLLQHAASSLQNDKTVRHVVLKVDVGSNVGVRVGLNTGANIGVGFGVATVPGGNVGLAAPHFFRLVQKLLQHCILRLHGSFTAAQLSVVHTPRRHLPLQHIESELQKSRKLLQTGALVGITVCLDDGLFVAGNLHFPRTQFILQHCSPKVH